MANQVTVRNGDLLYDNGPLANSQGTGSGGDDESILTELEGLFGSGAQKDPTINNAVFDDFTVPAPGWNVSSFMFYAYQTNAIPPTLDEAMVTVYAKTASGDVGAPVGGNCPSNTNYTNLMTVDTDVNRVNVVNGGSARQIQKVTVTLANACTLTPGSYWVGVQYSGDDAFTGPWQPPVAFPVPSPTCPATMGMAARQSLTEGLTFATQPGEIANGTCGQDIPFQVIGKAVAGGAITVDASPEAQTVAAGSTASFTVQITNGTANNATGQLCYQAGPLAPVAVANGTVNAGTSSPNIPVNINVPGTAPAGTYTVDFTVGPNCNIAVANDDVQVTVTNNAAPTGPLAEWTLAAPVVWPTTETAAARTSEVGAFPNPFAERTQIGFELEESAQVELVIYDVRGRAVATLADGTMEAGPHSVTFDAASLPSGVYVYRLVAGSQVETGRITLVK